jgi:SAM-dependent methyltransferase
MTMQWIWYVIAAVWALDALRMRARMKSIPALAPADRTEADGYGTISAAGTDVDDGTRASAAAYATRHDVALLDLIPFDTPALLAMGIVQLVDPAAYRTNPIAKGHSTGYALLATDDLFARAGVVPDERTDAAGLVRDAQQLKTFAINRAGLAIAPSLRAPSGNPLASWPSFSALVGRSSRFILALQGLTLAFLAAGLWMAPAAGMTALAIFHLQPLIVFGGLPLRPRDLGLTALARGPLECWNWLQLICSRIAMPTAPRAYTPEHERSYADQLKNGLAGFFDPRRETCPICDSPQLRPFLRTTDLIQRKPGEFVLDECGACGHIFQNPRLSVAGLDFYYRDFYDGIGTTATEVLLMTPFERYLARARVIDGLATPTRWLDVGTAHAHFCCAAKQAWPGTRFDGLDISSSIEHAERAGWVQRGYRGFLPDVAESLAGEYDVVSLFHCLEHTPDPRAEIAAAYTVLQPGGLLVIEVPDPDCPMGRVFGRFWFPWFQPQHLHLLSVKNLTRLLHEAGFEPEVVQRGPAHIQVEFSSTLALFLTWLAPRASGPWRPPAGRIERLRRGAVWSVGKWLLPMALFLDVISEPAFRRLGLSNAYRVAARRDRRQLRRRDVGVELTAAVQEAAEVM